MRKVIIFLVVLGLAFMTTSALAVGLGPNELVNGDFGGSGSPTLSGWTTLPGYQGFSLFITRIPPSYTTSVDSAGIYGSTSGMWGIYQIINEATFANWLPNGTGKEWRVDLDYQSSGAAVNKLQVLYYPTNNGGSQPALDGSFTGWNSLVSVSLPTTGGALTHYSISGEISSFQPQWIAYILELTNSGSLGYGTFTNNDFEARCTVPVPPSLLLLGSGLLGLGALGWRRKRG